MTTPTMPPFAGKTYEVRFEGLTALNAYADDGVHLRYTITEGPLRGASGVVRYTWQPVAQGVFAISWQENDGATVVHVDDFERGTSHSFFTTRTLDFHRLQGSLRPA
jgi:hypothetical protein